MSLERNDASRPDAADRARLPDDEGGLRAPPGLHGWRKAWWWFDFIILVKLARLRFIAILVVIGLVITQWDTLTAYYEKWTRPAGDGEAGGQKVEYFCPMHPSVVRDNNREKCPICFMPLSRRVKGSGRAEPLPAGTASRVQLSPYRIVLAGVQTWAVEEVPLTKDITAVGYVDFNERGQRTVAARVAGRIDKLFASETGQMVAAGDELASLYSPDLVVTAQNLVDAERSGNRELAEAARTRLALWGIDREQLDRIAAAGQPTTHLTIRSPIGGHVITKYVREGQYVEEGTPLYDLADLSTVWIQAQVYEEDLPFLLAVGPPDDHRPAAEGLDVTATTRAAPDEVFYGKLAFIYPHADQETRTVTVRFEVDNPGHRLRPGSTATVTLQVDPQSLPMFAELPDEAAQAALAQGKVLAVPETTVIDTGKQRLVYRQASPGVFDGAEVKLGPRMTGPQGAVYYPVLGGLKRGELVVTGGSFLVDAETRLNPAVGSVYSGGGSQTGRADSAMVRPSTPEDPDAKIIAALASLSPEDRALAERQRYCAVLGESRLGAMGPPVKLEVLGQPVFVCCKGCQSDALASPEKTLEKAEQLRRAGEPSGTK